MALETTASIISNLDINLPTNNQGQITAEILRTELKRIANNMRQSVEDIILVNPNDETDKKIFKRQDVKTLKEGKPIASDLDKALVSQRDTGSYIRTSARGRMTHYVGNKVAIDLVGTGATDSITLGGLSGATTGIPVIMPGGISSKNLIVTGSTVTSGSFENTGSFSTSGSFNVNNLLDLLSNYGQTGIPTGSGEGGGVSAGDINLDGQVNVNDLLLVLAGYGNPNQICTNQTIPPNVNHQYIGPVISICEGNTLTISNGSFCSITV